VGLVAVSEIAAVAAACVAQRSWPTRCWYGTERVEECEMKVVCCEFSVYARQATGRSFPERSTVKCLRSTRSGLVSRLILVVSNMLGALLSKQVNKHVQSPHP
jgi:hypothetical protein